MTPERIDAILAEHGVDDWRGALYPAILAACAEERRAALTEAAEYLRKSGVTLPAPEPTGTIEGAMNGGLCIALAVIESLRDREPR